MTRITLRRYIAYNTALWLVTAMLAGLVLMGVRQYGHGVIARQTARVLLADARAAADRGAWYDAQRTIRETLKVWPPFADRILADFGVVLSSLPLVNDEIRQMERAGTIHLTEMSRMTQLMAENGFPKEIVPVQAGTVSGEASLWLGRAAMERGDVAGAEAFFRNYWRENRHIRSEVHDRLLPNPSSGPESFYAAGRQLLFNGLWAEAYAAFGHARAAGYENADMVCWQGVEAELGGRIEEARQAYGEALHRLPNHRLALLRIQLLAKK